MQFGERHGRMLGLKLDARMLLNEREILPTERGGAIAVAIHKLIDGPQRVGR